MYGWIKFQGIPAAVAATKADKLSRSKLAQSLKVLQNTLQLSSGDRLVPFSAKTGQGREELLEIIGRWAGVDNEKT